jgi:hypothetical protein
MSTKKPDCQYSNCKRGCTSVCWVEQNDSYCPSNGTEGYSFIEEYCMNCIHCDPDPDGKKQCEIMLATMCFHPNEPEYPKEWKYINGEPRCTNHVHWDWGKNGDPDDPDNPNKPPDPPDPNQLDLFPLYPNELTHGILRKENSEQVQSQKAGV